MSEKELLGYLEQLMGRKKARIFMGSKLFAEILRALPRARARAVQEEGENPTGLTVVHFALSEVLAPCALRLLDANALSPLLERIEDVHMGDADGMELAREEIEEQTQGSLKALLQPKPIRSEEPKVGRNAPCPCGAKRPDGTPVKFKQCCGGKK